MIVHVSHDEGVEGVCEGREEVGALGLHVGSLEVGAEKSASLLKRSLVWDESFTKKVFSP